MKRFWTAAAVALFVLMVQAGCNDYNNTVQYSTGATITNISPSAMTATPTAPNSAEQCPNTPTGQTNNPCFTLYIIGSSVNGFQSNTLVEWNNAKLPPCTNSAGTGITTNLHGCSTYVDATDMTAYIPYGFVAKAGTAYVNTWTPQSGTGNNGLSNALTFTIYGAPNPVPQISSVTPSSANYCAYSSPSTCASVSITVAGSNFLQASQNGGSSITFTGLATYGIETAINVTSISSSQIKATIPGIYLCAVDAGVKINVINPPSAICIVNCPNLGGGDTNVTTPNFAVSGAAGTSTCPAQSPPNPNPTVVEETPAVSQDGRFVAYASAQNQISQILLRDTCVSAATSCVPSTQIVSVSGEGAVGNGESHDAAMTSEGRYVAFSSAATNLVSNPPSGRQIYLRDTCQGAATACKPSTMLVSVDEEGKLAGTESILPSISTSGRFVAFLAITPSRAPNSGKSNAANEGVNSGLRQVFVRDTCLGATNCTPRTTRISLQPGDSTPGTGKPAGPGLSGLARQLALSGSKSSTVFTNTVPIDDQVFLAIRNQ